MYLVRRIKTAYCKVCKKEVNPIKKPLETIDKVAWTLAIIITIGIGAIVYLIYRFRVVKKKYCPTCATLVSFTEKTEEELKPTFDTSTSKGKVLEKLEKIKEKKKPVKQEEDYYCPYCGSHISPESTTCPACKTAIK